MVELLLGCQALIAGCYVVLAYRDSGRDPFQHIYWLLGAYLGVYFIPLWLSREWMREQYAYNTTMLVCALPVIGLLFILLGYTYAIKRFARAAKARTDRGIRARGMARYGVFLCSLGVLGELWVLKLAGGAAVYYSVARTTGAPEGTTAYIYLLRWLWTVGLAIMIGGLTRRRQVRYFLTAGFFWLLAFGYNLAVGQRSGVFIYALLGLALLQVWRRKRVSLMLAAGVGLAAMALLGFVGITRSDYHWGSNFENVRKVQNKPPVELAKSLLLTIVKDDEESERNSGTYIPSMDVRLYLEYVRLFPTVVEYDYGVFYAQFLVQWIPRALWPDRPDFRLQKKEQVFAEIGTCHICSPSATLLGMYWMHGGVLAVCVLCLVTGAFFGFFDAHGRVGGFRSPVATAVYLSIIGVAAMTPISLGPLAGLSTLGPFVFLPLAALALFYQSSGTQRGRERRGRQLLPRAAVLPTGRM